MGVVYYGKFLTWFEVGRVSLLRDVGFAYEEWVRRNLQFPVVQAQVDYKASAKFDDEVLVKTRIASIGNTSIRFENEIYKMPEKALLATGHTVHVLTNGKGEKVTFTPEIRERFTSP